MRALTSDIKFSFVTWTYRVFNKLKVTIMGNGYSVVGYSILDTFLLWPAESIKCKQSCFRWTNLHNIVQNPDKRVAILGPESHFPSAQIEKLHTFGAPGTPVTCISSPLRSPGSSGRDSAAARLPLVRKRTRFARSSCFFLHQLTKEDYLLSIHRELELLVSNRLSGCQDRQEGVLPQLGFAWSKRKCALLGIRSSFLFFHNSQRKTTYFQNT